MAEKKKRDEERAQKKIEREQKQATARAAKSHGFMSALDKLERKLTRKVQQAAKAAKKVLPSRGGRTSGAKKPASKARGRAKR